jgi:hypothetical protein
MQKQKFYTSLLTNPLLNPSLHVKALSADEESEATANEAHKNR